MILPFRFWMYWKARGFAWRRRVLAAAAGLTGHHGHLLGIVVKVIWDLWDRLGIVNI